MKKQKNRQYDFDRGYAAACANLVWMHGISTEAEETFKHQFESVADLKKIGASEFDIEVLEPHFPENTDSQK